MGFENLKQQLPPVDTLKDFSTQFDKSPALRCKFIDGIVLKATTSPQEISHGLGQGYIRCVIAGSSGGNVVTPMLSSESTDATKRFGVKLMTAQITTINAIVYY